VQYIELEEALRQDLYKENEELYNQAVKELEVREEMINMKVKMMIAEYLAEPNAASQLYSENQEPDSQAGKPGTNNEAAGDAEYLSEISV